MNHSSDAVPKLRKKLPDIPPEELALHGQSETSQAASKRHDLPPEIIRCWQKRSRSLSGLDTVEFAKLQSSDADKENVEPDVQQNPDTTQNELSFQEANSSFTRSLPSTPSMY